MDYTRVCLVRAAPAQVVRVLSLCKRDDGGGGDVGGGNDDGGDDSFMNPSTNVRACLCVYLICRRC